MDIPKHQTNLKFCAHNRQIVHVPCNNYFDLQIMFHYLPKYHDEMDI